MVRMSHRRETNQETKRGSEHMLLAAEKNVTFYCMFVQAKADPRCHCHVTRLLKKQKRNCETHDCKRERSCVLSGAISEPMWRGRR